MLKQKTISTDPLFNHDIEYHKSELNFIAVRTEKFLYSYLGSGLLTTLFWAWFPLADFLSGREVNIGCWFGFDFEKSPQ